VKAALVAVVAVMGMPALAWAADASVESQGGPPSSKPLPEPRDAVQSIFSSHRYPFCHEPTYPLTPAEKAWCDLGAADNTQACPKLRAACQNEAGAKQIELPEPISFTLPELGRPLRLLLWALLGVGIGFLVFALVRHFLDHKTRNETITTEAPDSADGERAAELARQVETDVQRLLERARASAMAGDFRAAVSDAYAALLRRLEGAGVVRIEPDQTNGDYLRAVKQGRPTIAPGMAEVVSVVEVAQFGERPVTRESFESVFARVTGLLAERLGLFVLVGLALLSGSSCGSPRDDWDHSPSGRAGVIDYLGKRGFKVHERLLSLAKISESTADQLVLLPGASLTKEDWAAVEKWMQGRRHSLIIAGGRRELPSWIGMKVVEKHAAHVDTLALSDADAKRWGNLRAHIPEANVVQGLVEPKAQYQTILARKQGAYALVRWAEYGGGEGDEANPIVVLADDFLFRNVSLLVDDNAVLLDHLLRDSGTSLELAGDLTGLVAANPIQSVRRGRLGPALVQLTAFLLVFFLCKGARFGRPVAVETIQRRDFSEHVRALGLHYARARGERLALGFLGAYVGERLRERFRLRADRSLSGLAEAVSLRTGRPVGEVMRLLVEARDASKGEPAEKDARDLETASELCKLLEETGGTGGHKPIQSHV
jgi:hypothetical protein